MKKLIKAIEKMKPFFDAVARNVYLKSIKDGFISCMPIVIFSSIFLLVAYVPNIFGFHWSANIEAILMKPYNYSMGILAVAVSATTAKHFTDSLNRNMPENNQINSLSTMVCSIICFLMLSADSIKDGFANGYMGSKGLLTAFLTAFVVGGIYRFCISRDITIKMPEQVPPNLSQTFKDIIPFGLAIIIIWVFDLLFRNFDTDSKSSCLCITKVRTAWINSVFGCFQDFFYSCETIIFLCFDDLCTNFVSDDCIF